ncbi:aspartyl/asparaginyl beta-hydroxylase isoform X6 [Teleopsis dalmanni]|uniref:aspartyl/asparaginyl beta-hydroxylase isoform X6 n=1 Tax=Teleopsis dalmanni TaxID=139649 RepID=UPI0018CE9D1D|nr:aspartyl/asparaginyl beta-hydroxylase isoform X6 [Teleopsis dalmanni]
MSGDVQPRKRKDKKRKRDALDRKPEGDISRQSSFQDEDESSHGVHITKMGTDDVHLHVHHDHGTGGHWCAKVLFFSLLAILLGIISLIILENRGLSDLDTPLSESRFSNYFDGWVEEHREEHGHDAVEASIQEHDEHDEPFEEEEDDEEADEEEDEEEEDEHEHDIEGDDDENEKDTKEDSEENITEEPSTETDKDDEDEDKGEENVTEEVSKEQTVEDEDDDNDINEDTAENDEEPETKETREDNDNNVSNADEEDEEDEQDENTAEAEDAEESNEPITVSQENSQQTNEDDDDNENDEGESKDKDNEDEDEDEDSKNNEEPFDEEDDDGTFESLENVVDNDAEEMALLKEKARLQAEEAEKNAPPSAEDNEEGGAASSWASSLAVKIGVGVALALVARLVLIRKNPNSIVEMFKILYAFYIVRNSDEPLPEVVMKRRLTIATAEDNFPDDEEVPLLPEDEIKAKQPSDNTGGAQAYNIDDNDENEYYDDLFEKELRRANEEMMRENYNAALKLYDELSQAHPDKPKIFLVKAKALDQLSEKQRSNYLLKEALNAYKRYLAFDKILKNHTEYREAGNRCIERLRFLGLHMQTIAIHQYMIDRFPDEPEHKNQLVVSWLMMNRYTEAKIILKEILKRWPDDGFAQVHYGFILKQYYMDNENAALYLKKGIDSKAPGTQDGRFFYNLGDALQRLHRQPEALEIYKRGAELKLYPSTYQRSLYNYPSLLAQPFWTKEETTYASFFDILENNWQAIRDEGLNLLSADNLFLNEAENLREIGDWKQFEIYARGQRHDENCNKAPMTCEMIESFHAASKCKRGQVKFSVMLPNTHVWPHCGPTNCRLRAHLGLVIPDGTAIRVAEETRNWQEGKFIIFDDSFEHEVWHNGSSMRLVLIVDVWHPQLTELQRTYLSPI